MSWIESIVDQQIREAVARGEFDDLEGSGQPLPGIERPYDPGWWARQLVERERLNTALDQELDTVDQALARIWPLTNEKAVRTAVAELNARIETINASLPVQSRAHPLAADEIVALWRRFGLAGGGTGRTRKSPGS